MKKRLLWMILIIFLTLGVTVGEYQYLLSQVENDPLTEIYVICKDIREGDLIETGDLKSKFIRVKDLEKDYIQDPDQIIGQYAALPMNKGSIVLKSTIKESKALRLTRAPDNMLITFEFNGETSNAWNVRKGQMVELLFCTKVEDQSDILYQDVVVSGIFDTQVMSIDTNTVNEKRFVTFEIHKEEGYELISNRYKGRVEIIIL